MNVRVPFLLVVACAAGCGAGPARATQLGASASLAGCARLDPSFDTIVVTGRFQGAEVPILIDTGANSGEIAASRASGLVAVPGADAKFAGASGEIRDGAVYDIAGLSIGDVAIAPFRAHTSAIADDTGYGFAIGLPQLAPYVVDFDVDQGYFCLRDQVVDAPPLAPMTLASGTQGDKAIVLEATLANTRIDSFVLDTGSGVSMINEDLVARVPNRRLGAKSESLDGSGVRKTVHFIEVESLCTLGACARRHVLMPGDDISKLVGFTQRGIIGAPFLHGHRVILDFPRRQIGFVASLTRPARDA